MKRLLVLLTLLLVVVVPVAAQDVFCPTVPPCPPDATCPDLIECRPMQPGVFTDPEWLRVNYHRVTVTIENQIATTNVDLEFVNEGNALAEGTFMFPLPSGAAIDQLVMYINDQPIEAKILTAEEARSIYNEIVRQYRDPALLEYVGSSAVQLSVFPIPPTEKRRIQISYSQVLEVDNGLLHYVYPLKVTNLLTPRAVDEMSISVRVEGNDPISNVYSPSHPIAVSRDADDDTRFSVGYEAGSFTAQDDFSLYYGLANQNINVNLLTFRESATEDGFFMLLVQPPMTLTDEEIIPRDIIIVLDQSGSMFGEKWDQARLAAEYVLNHLNPQDRFNVVLFSTGWRVYSNQMEESANAQAAIDWVRGQEAVGGTDINGALTTALDMVGERPATILFLTDGLATEGEVDTPDILANVDAAAKPNLSIFTFGVGDDVDTFLLDSITRDHHGTSAYVRPSERIDEEVASLFSKISAPVLTNVTLDMGGLLTQDVYPTTPLPDLFAGTQLTVVGRYRGDASDLTVTLRGTVNGEEQTFVYSNLDFPPQAGGEAFIARLWATRRIGDLLNSIRLNGETPELVDSVVRLSIRYGIITPYTSFLIEEDDILSQTGRERAEEEFAAQAQNMAATSSGAGAVAAADEAASFEAAEAPAPAPTFAPGEDGFVDDSGASVNPIQTVNDKAFILQNGVWTDTIFQPDTMQTEKVVFLSDDYFALLDAQPALGDYFALGERVIVVLDGVAYEVVVE